MPNKLYILVVSSIFFTISDIFFSISCIFPKVSCMYLLDVLDILQRVFLSETARHKKRWFSNGCWLLMHVLYSSFCVPKLLYRKDTITLPEASRGDFASSVVSTVHLPER